MPLHLLVVFVCLVFQMIGFNSFLILIFQKDSSDLVKNIDINNSLQMSPQVDNNVTRHIKPSLSDPKWDTLILHYLGLDHIGHLGGPTSPLVPPKLREMDDVIQTIHEAMLEQV